MTTSDDEGFGLTHGGACSVYLAAFAVYATAPCMLDLTADLFGVSVLVCGAVSGLLAVLRLDEWLADVWAE